MIATTRQEERGMQRRTFIINSTEEGGVLFLVKNKSQATDALNLVRQAYERVTD